MARGEVRALLDQNYLVILGWMRSRLGLSGNDLLVYALVYGMTQEESAWFFGGASYIVKWTGTSTKTVYSTLKGLVERGLLLKREVEENRVRRCQYKAVVPEGVECSIATVAGCGENSSLPPEKTSLPPGKSFSGCGEKTSQYNITDNVADIEKKGYPPGAIVFDCLKGERYWPDEAAIAQWKDAYPAVDVLGELKRAKAWISANPDKRKTKKGMPRFLNGWLSQEQNRGRGAARPQAQKKAPGGWGQLCTHEDAPQNEVPIDELF